jgi:hypothetical protein
MRSLRNICRTVPRRRPQGFYHVLYSKDSTAELSIRHAGSFLETPGVLSCAIQQGQHCKAEYQACRVILETPGVLSCATQQGQHCKAEYRPAGLFLETPGVLQRIQCSSLQKDNGHEHGGFGYFKGAHVANRRAISVAVERSGHASIIP